MCLEHAKLSILRRFVREKKNLYHVLISKFDAVYMFSPEADIVSIGRAAGLEQLFTVYRYLFSATYPGVSDMMNK